MATQSRPANNHCSDSRTVEMEQAKTKRKRSGSRGAKRTIENAARARQNVWRTGDQPFATERLTTELNGREDRWTPEGRYADRREQRAKR